LFSLIFDLQLHARMSGQSPKREIAFYFRDLLRLFRNPSLASALNSELLQPLVDQLMREKHIYFPISSIIKKSPESKKIIFRLEFIFQPWEDNPEMAIKSLQSLVDFLREEQIKSGKALQGLETEALFAVSKLLQQIDNLRQSFSGFTSVRTLQRIFQQLIRSQTSPFFGEPLSGLQLMGLLETRNLDFKNLVLLSVNEGILPAAKTHRSFIPHDISSFFELPTYRERDAVFAYHFYRMIQRAENVWLVYNTETDEFGKGEQSRYITQLEEELKSPNTKITREVYVPQLNMTPEVPIVIEKTPELLSALMKRIGGKDDFSNLSPTGISNYINCSLQFYFRYLSGIKVDRPKDDIIGADVMGTVAHGVLEVFYRPFENKVIQERDLQNMLPKINEQVRQSFIETGVDVRDLESGTNLLTFKGIEKMIGNFIKSEIEFVKELAEDGQVLSIEKIEGDLQKIIHVDVLGELLPISFKGRTDRIDRIGNMLRVVDYKSGGLKPADVNLDVQSDIIENPKKAKALQLMQYALMTPDKYSDLNVRPGIISLRQPSLGLVALTVKKIEGLTPDERIETEQVFLQIATEIVNPEIPFEKTNDIKRCQYCDYKAICHR
jgi:ATP-dependent helicase/nuclease subunit B